ARRVPRRRPHALTKKEVAMASKKTPAKKSSTKKAPVKKSEDSPLLAHFPHPPPASPPGVGVMAERGEPGSWDDELDRLPDGPAPSLVGTHWTDKKQFWRLE